MKQERILQQLDRMVASGRITEDEAADLRAADGTDQFKEAVAAIQVRHAGNHVESAVAAGEMTQAEADDQLVRLRAGEHPKGLRPRLSKHRPRRD